MKSVKYKYPYSQGGAALVTALLVLVMLTMIGVSAVNNSSSELRRSNSAQEQFRTRYIMQSSAEYIAIDVMLDRNHADYAKVPKRMEDTDNAVGGDILFTSSEVPGIKGDGKAIISFKERTSYANLPPIRREASHISQGGSSNNNPPVFEIFLDITTDANKVAQARRGAVYYPPSGPE